MKMVCLSPLPIYIGTHTKYHGLWSYFKQKEIWHFGAWEYWKCYDWKCHLEREKAIARRCSITNIYVALHYVKCLCIHCLKFHLLFTTLLGFSYPSALEDWLYLIFYRVFSSLVQKGTYLVFWIVRDCISFLGLS